MNRKSYVPIGLESVRTYSIRDRKHKVAVTNMVRVGSPGISFAGFVKNLPRILAGQDFVRVVEAVVHAYRIGKPVIWGMGAHVIKCGLSPWVIDLMHRRVISAVAMNGAGPIHDVEVALIGQTSEDVAETLVTGMFGMVRETPELILAALRTGQVQEWGAGRSVGEKLLEVQAPYTEYSILANAAQLNVPVTVHIAIGTDTIHMHPAASGALLGEASYMDFRLLTAIVADLGDGGVYLNVGSAVILPEVFLKALTLARNLGHQVRNFTTVNMDMQQHYRPTWNVVRRPTDGPEGASSGYALTGQHELLIPLLAQAIVEEIG